MRTLPGLLAALLIAGVLLALAARPVPATSEPPAAIDPALRQTEEQIAAGRELYTASCASCHGPEGEGTPIGPSLVGVGAASADFQLRTGRMPLAGDPDAQPLPGPPAFDDEQIRQLVAFVASLDGGPQIPQVRLDDSLLQRGATIFFGNCAPGHGATARGGAVGGGAIAPPLIGVDPVITVEAMIVGPGQMPVFDLPQDDLDAVATYVEFLQRGDNPGGFSIGGIGPVPEGFVGWVVGIGALIPIVYLIGREWTRKEE